MVIPNDLWGKAIQDWLKNQESPIFNYSKDELSTVTGLPPDEWPTARINWDLSLDSQRYTLETPDPTVLNPSEMLDSTPPTIIIGETRVTDLDALLSPPFRRPKNLLWECLDEYKLARAILHIAYGRPISPVFICLHEYGGLFLAGGNHRYEVIKYSSASTLFFLTEQDNVDAIDNMLPVTWIGEAK